jgi:signal peptidase I
MRYWAVLFLCLLLISCSTKYQEQSEDLANQELVLQALIEENNDFRAVNNELRAQVVELSNNLSRASNIAQICTLNCPAVLNSTYDIPSPTVRVPLSDILVSKNNVLLNIPDVQHGIVAATKSMDPLLDENDVVLEVTPQSPVDVHIGDIIIYNYQGERIIHRVVAIGHDNLGWYAITKGDNTLRNDPPVRFEQISGVVVGIIY